MRDKHSGKTTKGKENIPTDVYPTFRKQQVISSDNSSLSFIGRYPRITPLAKFSESCWRFTFYLSAFIYGVIILQNVSI
jgi:hypothetical protein